MDKHQHHVLARRFGAAAIEERLTEVALLMQIAFPQCEWHLDPDPESRELQQLNVGFSGAWTALYFTNEELCAYSGEKRRCDTDHRLHRALGKLLDEHAVPDKSAH